MNATQTQGEMDGETDGVKLLLGDPRKALLRIAIPMVVAMAVQTAYNLIDAAWVSGLGVEALAAMGFTMPLFQVIMGIGMGLAVGAGSAVARRIGAKDKENANKVAVNGVILVTVIGVSMAVLFNLFVEDLLTLIGAEGESLRLSMDYVIPLATFSIMVLYYNLLNNMTMSEGNAKRAMNVMLVASVLNIVLDPILIYVLDMGIAGAAWATLIAFTVSAIILMRWYAKGENFVSLDLHGVRPERRVQAEILRVGLPSSVQEMGIAISGLVLIAMISSIGGDDGTAIYSSGFRIYSMAIVPLFGIAMAMTTVSGALFGARRYDQLLGTLKYAAKIGTIFEVVICLLMFVFAPQIVSLYTWSEGTVGLQDGIATFVRIVCLSALTGGIGIFSMSMFQGVGHGTKALIGTILQFVVFEIGFVYLFGNVFEWGIEGIWWGIVVGMSLGAVVLYIWARFFVSALGSKAPPSDGAEVDRGNRVEHLSP